MTALAIRTEGLSKRYGDTLALDGLDTRKKIRALSKGNARRCS